MKETAQNNPILYIFIDGIDEDIKHSLCTALDERIGGAGVGYLFLSEDCFPVGIQSGIERVHSAFITKKYRRPGEVRVNYVLNADGGFSIRLPEIKRRVEHYLAYLYPAGIAADVYAVMDDASAVFSERRIHRNNVINMLNELDDDVCVYILSNINSRCTHTPENKGNIINSIAFMAVIKDCVPAKQRAVNGNIYNERYFKQNAAKIGGRFMSMGYCDINEPMRLVREIFVIKLLRYMDKGVCETVISINPPPMPPVNPAFDLHNLAGVPMARAFSDKEKKTLVNKQALEEIYGNRLDLYYNINDAQTQYEDIIDETCFSSNSGFYDVYHATSPNGTVMARLTDLQKQNTEAMREHELSYNNWLNQVGTRVPKKLFFNGFDEYPFVVARKYLEYKLNLRHITKTEDLILKTVDKITRIHSKYSKIKKLIDAHISKIKPDIYESGLEVSRLERWTDGYIQDNYAEYLNLYKSIDKFTEEGNLDKYIGLLNDYVEEKLLPAYGRLPITEDYLMDWAENSKVFNIFLKTGVNNFHHETNVILSAESGLDLSGEKVNLFYEDGDNGICIIYHLGGFYKEDLCYAPFFDGEV